MAEHQEVPPQPGNHHMPEEEEHLVPKFRRFVRWYKAVYPGIPIKIMEKMAFKPPVSSYTLTPNGDHAHRMVLDTDDPAIQNLLNTTIVRWTDNDRGSHIVTAFSPRANSRHTLFVSHSGTGDLGKNLELFTLLMERTNCNVFSYDYSGYGCSTGKPSDANIYADARAALEVLVHTHRVPETEIVLFGQFIGTAPSIHLAMRNRNFAGLILHAPMKSYGEIKMAPFKTFLGCDILRSADKIRQVVCSTTVIHNEQDTVVPFPHGEKIFTDCPGRRGEIARSLAPRNQLDTWDLDFIIEFITNQTGNFADLPEVPANN
uniref:Hydrolase_4 domain-containing protein n=1 Tax=Panagrellus redivivus TaxID=6233 RepID=A0A7E4UN03_PANRE